MTNDAYRDKSLMESVKGYESSGDEAEHPPPPIELEEPRATKRLCRRENVLPVVLPVKPRKDRFLVHICLPVNHLKMDEFVKRLLGRARLRLVGKKAKTGFTMLQDLHVSVARPTLVREASIKALVKELRESLADCGSVHIALQAGVVGFCNGSRRRMFVAAPLTRESGDEIVQKIVRVVDGVYQNFKLPPFFEDPKLHMSFAWTEKVDVLPAFSDNEALREDNNGHDGLIVSVDKARCSIGKLNYYFTLNHAIR